MTTPQSGKFLRASVDIPVTFIADDPASCRLKRLTVYYKEASILSVELSIQFSGATFQRVEESELFGMTKASRSDNLLGELIEGHPVDVTLHMRRAARFKVFSTLSGSLEQRVRGLLDALADGSPATSDHRLYVYATVEQQVPGKEFFGGYKNILL